MRQFFLIFLAFTFLGLHADAQKTSRQYPGKVKYQKVEQDATVFDIPYPAGEVEDGLKDLAAKKGVKVKEKNGFWEARNIPVDMLGGKTQDVYYKVEKDGRNECKVYMIIAEPGEDIANRTSSHVDLAGAAAGGAVILASVVPHLDDHDFGVVKGRQEDEVKKAEKKLASLQEDQSKLQRKLDDINKDIDRNSKDLSNAAAELESKKSALAGLLEKRGGGKKD